LAKVAAAAGTAALRFMGSLDHTVVTSLLSPTLLHPMEERQQAFSFG
jgi:hypothetical protein